MRVISSCALFAVVDGVLFSSDAAAWTKYKQDFQKTFSNGEEETMRFNIFQQTVNRINDGNAKNGDTAVFGLTWSSDRTKAEKYQRGFQRSNATREVDVVKVDKPKRPKTLNWEFTDAVTAVKNQGQCGSCWAFSATETIESHYQLATGVQVSFSPQQITSCTTADYGCDGGEPMDAYDYVMSVAGLTNEWFYPYTQSMVMSNGTYPCDTAKVTAINGSLAPLQGAYTQITGYKFATPPCEQPACFGQDLDKLAESLETGPVSVCVDAQMWDDYLSGVMTANACGPAGGYFLDHCVQLVGFNRSAPMPYWIVRNSWSTTWGEAGFIYLQMEFNTCGVADEATIPAIADVANGHREQMFAQASGMLDIQI